MDGDVESGERIEKVADWGIWRLGNLEIWIGVGVEVEVVSWSWRFWVK